MLFDRRLNLSFEAAVKDLSISGIVALTEGFRALRDLLQARVAVADAAEGRLLFDGALPLTAYDLPLYTPPVYLSQLAQYMDRPKRPCLEKQHGQWKSWMRCWSWPAAFGLTLRRRGC